MTGAYPQLNDRALRLLRVPPTSDAIKNAIRQSDAQSLEEAMGEQRVIGAMHRTTEEWSRHHDGQVLAKVPLIDIRKIGDSEPVPFTSNPRQPLSGIKGLALTHVIAGSCAARTLADYGAEILQVARDQSIEHEVFWMDVFCVGILFDIVRSSVLFR